MASQCKHLDPPFDCAGVVKTLRVARQYMKACAKSAQRPIAGKPLPSLAVLATLPLILAARAAPVEKLPIRDYAAAKDSPVMAVLYSGDGGWGSLEDRLSRELAANGIPVAGWNSLRYFWKKKSPETAADDLATVLRERSERWGRRRFVLAGHSFGADVLPFLVQRLPPDLRSRVALVALVSPTRNADFEFHFSGWFGDYKRADSLSVVDGIAGLRGLPVLCLYGRDDPSASCAAAKVRSVVFPGGHRLVASSAELAAEIFKAVRCEHCDGNDARWSRPSAGLMQDRAGDLGLGRQRYAR